jgi:hypothetical protein
VIGHKIAKYAPWACCTISNSLRWAQLFFGVIAQNFVHIVTPCVDVMPQEGLVHQRLYLAQTNAGDRFAGVSGKATAKNR